MAAREIIVIDIAKATDGSGAFTVTGALWLTAPANRVKPRPSFVSAVPLASAVSWGVTTAELAALQAGTIVEKIDSTGQLPSGTTVGATQTALVGLFNAAQTALNNEAAGAKFIGASWDGAAWTAAP